MIDLKTFLLLAKWIETHFSACLFLLNRRPNMLNISSSILTLHDTLELVIYVFVHVYTYIYINYIYKEQGYISNKYTLHLWKGIQRYTNCDTSNIHIKWSYMSSIMAMGTCIALLASTTIDNHYSCTQQNLLLIIVK